MITDTCMDTAAKTVWGEARGEGEDGMLAVACVIVNRTRKTGKSLMEVCLQKWQFSCWNEGDPNLPKMQALDWDDQLYRMAMIAVLKAIDLPKDKDPTKGSRHYHTPAVKPKWAEGQTPAVAIGNHYFYTGIN